MDSEGDDLRNEHIDADEAHVNPDCGAADEYGVGDTIAVNVADQYGLTLPSDKRVRGGESLNGRLYVGSRLGDSGRGHTCARVRLHGWRPVYARRGDYEKE